MGFIGPIKQWHKCRFLKHTHNISCIFSLLFAYMNSYMYIFVAHLPKSTCISIWNQKVCLTSVYIKVSQTSLTSALLIASKCASLGDHWLDITTQDLERLLGEKSVGGGGIGLTKPTQEKDPGKGEGARGRGGQLQPGSCYPGHEELPQRHVFPRGRRAPLVRWPRHVWVMGSGNGFNPQCPQPVGILEQGA